METKAKFEDLGWKCSMIGHGYAPWLEEMMNIVIPSWDCLDLHDVLLEMSKVFNESFAEYDFNAPYYREFLIVSKHQLPELSSFVKNIDNEVEVKYQNFVRDTRETLFAESLKIISKKDKNIQDLHNELMKLSDWATSIKGQLDNNSKELDNIKSNFWYRVLRKLRLIK